MKFAVAFAWILGIAFPVLETNRRGFGHWLINATTMADDYIMGAVLLCAAIAWALKKPQAKIWLVIAWAYVLGVMNAAFWGHLEGYLRNVTICDNNPLEVNAIIAKGLIWLIALVSLLLSARALARDARDGRREPPLKKA